MNLRRGLVVKYVAYFATLVSVVLVASSLLGMYLSYGKDRQILGQLQQERARSAALQIERFIQEIERHLALLPQICAGGKAAGPIGELPQHERWHWLVSPKSTIIQTSEVHSGLCTDPAAELEHLMKSLVR